MNHDNRILVKLIWLKRETEEENEEEEKRPFDDDPRAMGGNNTKVGILRHSFQSCYKC